MVVEDFILRHTYKLKWIKNVKNNTHKSLYSFNRLLFRVKVTHSIFQQVMDTMPAGLDFAAAYLDNILIKCETIWQHSENIQQVFQRRDDYAFKVNEEKCQLFRSNIKKLMQIGINQTHEGQVL